MKSTNTNNNKAAAKPGLSATGKTKTGFFGQPRGRKKKDADNFDDLNMTWDADVQDEESVISSSAGRRKRYSDDEESDSYEGTGLGRSRFGYDDEDLNDPYETFRRG